MKIFAMVLSYKVDTIFILQITKGNDSITNVGGIMVLNLCTSSDQLYICT